MSESELETIESNEQQQSDLQDRVESGEVDSGPPSALSMAMNALDLAGGMPKDTSPLPSAPSPQTEGPAPAPKAQPVSDDKAQQEGDKVLKAGSPKKVGEKAEELTPDVNKLDEQSSGEMDGDEQELKDLLSSVGIDPSNPESVPDLSISETVDKAEARVKAKQESSESSGTSAPQTEQLSEAPQPNHEKKKRRRRKKKPKAPEGRSSRRRSKPSAPERKKKRKKRRPAPPPPAPIPDGVAPIQSRKARAGKDARENAEVDPPSGGDLMGEFLDVGENAGDFTALYGNGGKENTGHNAVGTLWAWDKDDKGKDIVDDTGAKSREDKTNSQISGVGDMGAGLAGMGSDTLGMYGGMKRFREAEDGAEKAQGVLETGSSATNFFSNFVKFSAGAVDTQGKYDATELKKVGDGAAIGGDTIGLFAKAVENGRNLRKFGKHGKTWKDASKATRAKRFGNAIQRTVDIGTSLTKIGNNVGKMAEQGAKAVSSGPNVVGQYVLAPVGLAVSTYEMGKNAAAMVTAGKNRTKLTKSMNNFTTKDGGVTDKKGRTVQVVDDREADQMAMLDHLHGINKKRQKRAGLNMTTNAISAAGSAMTISGMGAVGGMAAGAASASIKLGAMAVRKGKQHGRDSKSKKMDKYRSQLDGGGLSKKKAKKLRSMEKDELKHRFLHMRKRAKANRLSESEMEEFKQVVGQLGGNPHNPMKFKLSRKQRISLAFRYDTTKSSKKKEGKNTKVAETILALWRDVEPVYSQAWDNGTKIDPSSDAHATDVQKKLERFKAAYHGMGVDQKKWKTIVKVTKNDDQKLLKEILKQMGKRD